MAHYRLYVLDDEGHIRRGIDLECADDEEAVTRAAHLADGCAVEVWEKTRRVRRLPASNAPSAQMADGEPAHALDPLSVELDWASQQVADARKQVEQLAKRVEDDMRRGNPTTESRKQLAACQDLLRGLLGHLDALSAQVMKRKPADPAEPLPPDETTPRD